MSFRVVEIYNDPEPVTVVLWVSRHKPLPVQIQRLKEKLGNIRIIQVDGTVPNAETVVEIAQKHNAKIIVPVLPLSFIARLVELSKRYGFTVLYAKMEAIATVGTWEEAKRIIEEAPDRRTATTYADGTIKIHEFKGFEVIKAVQIVTEPW